MPRTPFIGVRISWLMVARKLDLARPACRASSRAVSAAARSATAWSRAAFNSGIIATFSLNALCSTATVWVMPSIIRPVRRARLPSVNRAAAAGQGSSVTAIKTPSAAITGAAKLQNI